MHGNKAGRLAAARRELDTLLSIGCRGDLEAGDDGESTTFTRNEAGDVSDYRAFDRHMRQVGEEDQSQPGWDNLP